jgi:hypothetical protein
MAQLRAAQAEVEALRGGAPVDHDRLFMARGSLLLALEGYAQGLVARRLPIPARLRDELRLQRDVHDSRRRSRSATRPGGPGWRRT